MTTCRESPCRTPITLMDIMVSRPSGVSKWKRNATFSRVKTFAYITLIPPPPFLSLGFLMARGLENASLSRENFFFFLFFFHRVSAHWCCLAFLSRIFFPRIILRISNCGHLWSLLDALTNLRGVVNYKSRGTGGDIHCWMSGGIIRVFFMAWLTILISRILFMERIMSREFTCELDYQVGFRKFFTRRFGTWRAISN